MNVCKSKGKGYYYFYYDYRIICLEVVNLYMEKTNNRRKQRQSLKKWMNHVSNSREYISELFWAYVTNQTDHQQVFFSSVVKTW